jgi:hypothetical protein
MKCLPVPGKKMNIILMCALPLTVPILSSSENLRNFERSSVWKHINFSSTYYGWRYMFHSVAVEGWTLCIHTYIHTYCIHTGNAFSATTNFKE